MIGLRGFPGVQGGVEVHAEHLCPILAELGCQIEVMVRSPYMTREKCLTWRGVKFRRIWAPKSKRMEAIVHSVLSVFIAAWRAPDLLHIQAVGPALVTPIARLLRLRVVVTHHGPDYDRQKWGRFARRMLRVGECFGMRLSSKRIVISRVIQNLVRDKYGVDSVVIPNGVEIPELAVSTDALERFRLDSRRYVLFVGRLVPEKRHMDLIEAFAAAGLPGWKLALVGSADHPDDYQTQLNDSAASLDNVVMTGFQSGSALHELYSHAGMFVLPSSHEGLPIALLEALSYGLPVLASDIPANLEIGLPADAYFATGDVEMLARRIKTLAAEGFDPEKARVRRAWVAQNYDWRSIAQRTLDVYRAAATVSLKP